ncbi:MAG: SH3 domain-containing protein [Clostridia bacterium]|nr:SH3 domain-containing protein [Clostridia bacterium]
MKLLKNVLIVLTMVIAFLLITNSIIFAKTVTVNTDTLKLRKEASTDSITLELLNNGDKLEYIEETGDWYKVKVKGMTGYVHKDYVKLEQTQEAPTEEKKGEEHTTKPETESPTTQEIEQTQKPNNEELPANEQMKVLNDTNIYILPLINATTIQNIKKDSEVTIIAKTNGWYYVETSEVMGWIREKLLIDSSVVPDDITSEEGNNLNNTTTAETETPASSDTKITNKIMYVNTSSIYVRKGPSTDTEVIDSLILNATVKVTAENGDWYKVEVDGKTGYIAKRLLSDKQVNTTSRGEAVREEDKNVNQANNTQNNTQVQTSKGNQIVEYAKKYLGCKYVYGASGPNKFDCSGFTMYVFKNFGVKLSHSATAQSKVGTYVAKENLQLGDLVFFTDYETGNGIGHCGIYIGDGNFIHASSGTGYCVKISTLTSGSYLKRYETARRLAQ